MVETTFLLAAAIVSAPLYGLWYEFYTRRIAAKRQQAEMVWRSHSEVTSL